MVKDTVGIAGMGTYLPDKVMKAAELSELIGIPEWVVAEKFGINQKYMPGSHETTSYMGIKAAQKALKNAGIDPMEVDLVIWNGAQHKDYPCWLAGLKVAETIGAKRAWSFDMEAMCGSMMVGLDLAKSIMLTRYDVKTVLLVSGYRNVDLINPSNPSTTFMADIGAGGAAVVLKKGLNRNLVLGSSFRGDGSFSEDCIVSVGGSKKWPMEATDYKHFWFDIAADAEDFKKRLGEKTMPNFYGVIRDSLSISGYSQEDMDYLAILHFKRSAHLAVLNELGLDESQTTYLDDYGHIGQNDQILSMELGIRSGKIKPGSIIVMVGAGLGFVWAATTVRWGGIETEELL